MDLVECLSGVTVWEFLEMLPLDAIVELRQNGSTVTGTVESMFQLVDDYLLEMFCMKDCLFRDGKYIVCVEW